MSFEKPSCPNLTQFSFTYWSWWRWHLSRSASSQKCHQGFVRFLILFSWKVLKNMGWLYSLSSSHKTTMSPIEHNWKSYIMWTQNIPNLACRRSTYEVLLLISIFVLSQLPLEILYLSKRSTSMKIMFWCVQHVVVTFSSWWRT